MQVKEPGVGPRTARRGFHGVVNHRTAFPDLSQLCSDLCQVPCGLMQMILSHILELKPASTEIHRNWDIFPEEKHAHLRNSQKRQRCPLQGHLSVKSSLSRMEGDRCFKIPIALIVQ